MPLLRWLDIPPTWLVAALGVSWGLDRVVPGLGFGLATMRWLGAGLVLLGLVAMALGAFELLRHRTTFVPRQRPSEFVRNGIYRITRNPIYLGDALVLTGAALAWDVLPALLIVPAFMGLITRRFILDEEAGLIAAFGTPVEAWFSTVRRWL